MKARPFHEWDLSPADAREVQRHLAPMVSRTNHVSEHPRYVAGVDISSVDHHGEAMGAVVVLTYPQLEVAEVQTAVARPLMPYVPGLLSFRESPVLIMAMDKLSLTPDIIMVDGHGLAHPRRFGIACHLGLVFDVPAIGCGKSILRGRHGPLGIEAGSTAELVDKEEVVGAALRTQAGKTPIYPTIGHKVDLPAAIRWVMACTTKYRMPEPTRLAHLAASGRPVAAGTHERLLTRKATSAR